MKYRNTSSKRTGLPYKQNKSPKTERKKSIATCMAGNANKIGELSDRKINFLLCVVQALFYVYCRTPGNQSAKKIICKLCKHYM